MHFPGKCILTRMQSAEEKLRGITIFFFFNMALRKTMVHSLKLCILSPIYTVTSLAEGKGLPSVCELWWYLQARSARGHTLNSAPHNSPSSFLPPLCQEASCHGSQPYPCAQSTLQGPTPHRHLLCADIKDATMLFPRSSCRVLGYNYVPQ